MRYTLASLATRSYWRYALFSKEPISRLLADIGALFLILEVLDFFGVYSRNQQGRWTLFMMVLLAVAHVLITRRPINRITYKIPKKDICYEVRIGDLLDCDAGIVISTNTTFDTDMSNGLIAPNSLQGQMARRHFNGNTTEIDRQIVTSLRGIPNTEATSPGKKKRYPIGTVAKILAGNRVFYLLAMADLNEHGNAQSSVAAVDTAMEKLWSYIARQGDLGDLAVPLIGTGRGRIELPRKKIIERIAQSFAYASRENVFANRLIINVHPDDASKHEVNLFEVRDYLSLSLHV